MTEKNKNLQQQKQSLRLTTEITIVSTLCRFIKVSVTSKFLFITQPFTNRKSQFAVERAENIECHDRAHAVTDQHHLKMNITDRC